MNKIIKREEFLHYIRWYIGEDPEVIPHIFKTVEIGTKDFISKARRQACDYETALMLTLPNKRSKKMHPVAASKLKKYVDKNKVFHNGWTDHPFLKDAEILDCDKEEEF